MSSGRPACPAFLMVEDAENGPDVDHHGSVPDPFHVLRRDDQGIAEPAYRFELPQSTQASRQSSPHPLEIRRSIGDRAPRDPASDLSSIRLGPWTANTRSGSLLVILLESVDGTEQRRDGWAIDHRRSRRSALTLKRRGTAI